MAAQDHDESHITRGQASHWQDDADPLQIPQAQSPATEVLTPGLDEDLANGMLPRDVPQRTTFYDPIAERQLSQTDAKLFYQRSKLDIQTNSTSWSQSTPDQSPVPVSASHCDAELGGQASMLDTDIGDASRLSGQQYSSPHTYNYRVDQYAGQTRRLAGSQPAASADPLRAHISTSARDHATGASRSLINQGLFDTEPQITAELSAISKNIQKIRDLRNKYMTLSAQRPEDNPRDQASWEIYPPPPEPAWQASRGVNWDSNPPQSSVTRPHTAGAASASFTQLPRRSVSKRKPGQHIGEDFDMDHVFPLPEKDRMVFQLDDSGVYQVFDSAMEKHPSVKVPTIREFYMDLDEILTISSDGPSKSFAFRRLQYLEAKFNLYVLLNEYQETADSKKVPHRDFYNVRKVDTHVHHSACMNQKHLLRFIKSKMKKFPNEVVLFRDGKHLTLAEVFASINLTAYDLSIDTLDMHAHTDSFHRFDKFNLKYNPIGESRLRTIFLKTDNFIHGRYLAEITQEVISDLESSKYQMVEWRISVYGKSQDEWDKLAAWVVDNKLFSHNVRWLVQIPRLYDVYKASGLMNSFEQVVTNIFKPLFEVTEDPSSHPKLHVFLQRVIGFDSVDDESKVERRLFKKFPVPKDWTSNQNPPYSYWIYYLFANMVSLNFWRKRRGFNTFVLRPHAGEAGDSDHIGVTALCCHSISHGLLLRKVPLMQYVFYLDQIGIAMSPLSNNALFLAYERNPFNTYFRRGLNVSLSTDDPLQFAFTKEPLIEEYAVAAQIYKLSPVDMCELAKNSVLQSGYELSIKKQWLGSSCDKPGKGGNTMVKTNIPDRREEFRHQTLVQERDLLKRYIAFDSSDDQMSAPVYPETELSSLEYAGQISSKAESVTDTDEGLTMGSPRKSRGDVLSRIRSAPHDVERVTGSDQYISGSDPRIFPGVVTRGLRSGSVRSLTAHDAAVSSVGTAAYEHTRDE